MNMLPTVLSTVALLLALIAVLIAIRFAAEVRSQWDWILANNKKSVGLSTLTKLETELTEHADSIGHLNKSLNKLRSRIGMREIRANGKDDSVPDPLRDPDGYKRVMRLKIFNKGKADGDT